MRLISEIEQNLVAGGDMSDSGMSDSGGCGAYDAMGNYGGPTECPSTPLSDPNTQTVEISGQRMTQNEKDQYDNQQAAVASIIDSCALGSPACIPGLYALKP